MSDRAKLPLNQGAVCKSDDEFYDRHPELVKDGRRIPLDANAPAQAQLRKEWMTLYLANGGEREGDPPSKIKPPDPILACPKHDSKQGRLVVKVVDLDEKPIADATVTANGLTKETDKDGKADFGLVDPKSYKIAAGKDGYSRASHDGEGVQVVDTVEVVPGETTTAKDVLTTCILYTLNKKPFLIARGSEGLTPPIQTISIPGSVGGTLQLEFGQDTTHGVGGKPVTGHFLGEDEKGLRAKMLKLVDVFAKDDTDGKAKREFDAFLNAQNQNMTTPDHRAPSTIKIYTDPKLDKAIEVDQNFVTYPDRTLAEPAGKFSNPPKTRIHQSLLKAGYDVNRVTPITDLGVPAFNAGDTFPLKETGDWANGLAVMIDSVQHVLVFVDQYEFDVCKDQYTITLIFELYDVFGLDDDDIRKFGINDSVFDTVPQEGITAWWQLQHQFDYAPLITKAVVTRKFTVSTK